MNTILIVDDSATYRKACGDMLASHGYETIFAVDGNEAISLAKEQHPDLILMDVRMAAMSGIEALKQIKTYNPTIPVIIMVVVTQGGVSR